MDGLKARLSFDAVAYDYDDEYLTIDTDTHIININNLSRLFGVQYDGNSKLIKFRISNKLSDIQKMQDSIVYINWIDSKGVKGQSIAINKTISNDICEFAWKVPFDALKNSGVLHFAVSAVVTKNSSSVIDQRWSTQIASVITPDGIYIKSYTPSSEEEDRIAQIYNELSKMINKQNDNLQSQVNSLNETLVNGKILQYVSLTSDNLQKGYIQTNNTINSIQNYAHTINSIELKPKSTVILKAKGYRQDVVMIAQYVGSTTVAKPLVVSIDNELNTYTYINDTEYTINVLLSFLDDNTAKAYVINTLERTDYYLDYVKKNVLINVIDKIYPERIQGAFINNQGNIVAMQYYFYSKPIPLKKNERISITSSDESGSAVARVSLSDDTGTTLQPINLGTKEQTTFNYTAPNDCYIVVSSQISNVDFHIVKECLNVPETIYSYIFGDKKETYPTISMFDDIAVCGDSYTAGSVYKGDSLLGDNDKTRWGTVLSRITGANVTTYASGGADTLTYQTREECLLKILNDNPHELYVLCLGINDKERVTLGSLSDIKQDYAQNENTFYGNYGKIISQIKEHAPNAKILISKVFIVTYAGGAYYDYSNKAVEEIANYFNIPFIDTKDDSFFSSAYFDSSMVKGHPVAPTYSGIAVGMNKLISKCIESNPNYFNDYYPS